MTTQNEKGPGSEIGPDMGPKVTLEAIEDFIAEQHFALGGQMAAAAGQTSRFLSMDTLTICVLVLKNGFTVVGKSACADPKNFNTMIGRQIARQDAINQIWPLMGFELRTRLDRMKQANLDEAIDEPLTRLTAFQLGNPEAFRREDAEAILAAFEKMEGAK